MLNSTPNQGSIQDEGERGNKVVSGRYQILGNQSDHFFPEKTPWTIKIGEMTWSTGEVNRSERCYGVGRCVAERIPRGKFIDWDRSWGNC